MATKWDITIVQGKYTGYSLSEFMNFKLFGKTILVVNIKFGYFFGAIHSASEDIVISHFQKSHFRS